MQIYDTNKNRGPFTLPIYYAGKQWGANPNPLRLIKAGLFHYVDPEIDKATQKLGDIQIGESDCTHQVRDKTAADIQAERSQLVDQVLAASKYHVDSSLDPDGMILVNNLYMAGAPKGTAVFNWGVQIRKEGRRRMALIQADQSMINEQGEPIEPTDFSMFGEREFTIDELMIEAGI